MTIFEQRRERICTQIQQSDIDACLITNPLNVTYLTGFSGDSSFLVVGPEKTLMISDGRYTVQLAEECPGLATHIRPPSQTINEAAGEVLSKLQFRTIEFESNSITVADFERLKDACKTIDFKPAKDRVELLREVKDEHELERIRAAIRMGQRAFAMFRSMLQIDDTEKKLNDAMEMYVRRAGGKCTAFPTIVAVGARAALPHAPPTDRKISASPLLLVDWGAQESFYKSDFTRVLLLRHGKQFCKADEDKLREIYGVVLRAQQAAIDAVHPGAKAQDVDGAARKVIADAGYADFFKHSVGHGFGLQIHERPHVRQKSEGVLQAGMVTTIEPGIYLPDFGGVRIEDDVLVTEEGHEVLTDVPKDWDSQWCEL